MKRILSILSVFSFAAMMTLSSAAQANKQGAKSATTTEKQSAGAGDTDSTFVAKAARGDLAEMELGQLAAQKASSQEVKKFGQRMVDDHTKANDELKQVAAEKHINLPQQLDARDKAMKARLEKLSGQQFDRAYMRDVVRNHQKDLAEFERESKMAKDPAVKSFAQQTLPTLREHLKEAEKIAPKQQTARTSGL